MKQKQLAMVINSFGGRFFSITFRKKDGTVTTRCAKRRVGEGKAGRSTTREAGYVNFFDINAKGWRCTSPDRVLRVRCGRVAVEVDEPKQLELAL